ncbi:MAG: hypothetical protein M3Y91_18520 [Actinomycetota bacterium]|nr:hypothetical protein [Actinomycetota bacterium]
MSTALSEATLEEAATDVARLATLLDHVDATIAERTRQLVWQGSAAQRFDDRIRAVRAAGQSRSEELVHVARLLRAAAERVRAEQVALSHDQTFVDTVLRTEHDPTAFLRSIGWTRPALPPPGDPAWQGLAERVRDAADHPGPPTGGAGL